MRALCLAVVSLCVLLPAAAPSAAQDMDNRLTLDRYLDWEDVSSPQLSPDGGQIVYQREWIDAINDSTRALRGPYTRSRARSAAARALTFCSSLWWTHARR